MKKSLLLLLSAFFVTIGYSQTNKYWSSVSKADGIKKTKTANRISFPEDVKLFQLDLNSLKQSLSNVADRSSADAKGVIISMPNLEGATERFQVFEASNFDPILQAQFPEIRAYVGIGVDDVYAQLRMSLSPNGIQTMVFRTDKRNEFMEPYSADGSVYAIYNSSRIKGNMPFTCGTNDVSLFNEGLNKSQTTQLSNTGQLKTFKLAISCTAEYSNYFGANSSSDVGLVLAQFNATMTRVNGVFEKDFAVHMNLIPNEASIIYYDPNSDPYSDAANIGNWNAELQSNLTATITEAVYDIGHLFGATGGGGNAGCIGCVCVNGSKGSGYTSPGDGVPSGDSFDIDYVAHEMGHQFGGNHTFSYGGLSGTENNAVNVEPGSGSTVMSYAGITGSTDVQPHSDDYFAYRSILQVQTNLVSKTCPTTTTLNNPVFSISAGGSYTIPKSTAFKLTGTRTDAGTNPLTYCWEENDDATTNNPTASFPSPTKTNGPNYRSFNPVSSLVRYFPAFSTVLNNSLTSMWETASSVARVQNFSLTARDNIANGGQTQSASMVVTVSGTVGPFTVTSQNSSESWITGQTKTITWNRNGAETLAGSTNVDILLSIDGGTTFPYTIASNVVNSGTANITVPSTPSSLTCRLMIRPTGNIYYALNTTNFYIGYTITNTCNTYNYTTAFTVPDNSPTYTIKSIAVPSTTGTISDVNVTVNATHPNIQNLNIAVVRPNGPLATLYNQGCASGANMNVTFDTQGTTMVCASPTNGTYQPSSSTALSAMNGATATGNWQVGFRDLVAGTTGTINSFSIEICTQVVALANDTFSFENFSLYPNPNDGSFNIKFNSNSNKNIKVAVYDMRGREIFTKSYQNSGLFEQNLQLSNVQSGIYLVNIQDGEQKMVKKIVVQ